MTTATACNSLVSGDLVQIYWHNKLPVFSVDIDKNSAKLRFATGGADNNARIWEVNENSGEFEFIATLSKHIRAINCVRWSPTLTTSDEQPTLAIPKPSFLATGGDGGSLFLWHQVSNDNSPGCIPNIDDSSLGGEDESSISKESWKVKVNLETGNPYDIYALEWSPCGKLIATGTSNDSVRIYSIKEGQCIKVIRDHSHFVNGVCWDPLRQFLISISSDRSVKVNKILPGPSFRSQSVGKIAKFLRKKQEIEKEEIKNDKQEAACNDLIDSSYSNHISCPTAIDLSQNSTPLVSGEDFRLFADESIISFFRRGSFTPDGLSVCTSWSYRRQPALCPCLYKKWSSLGKPSLPIGGFDKSSVGVFFVLNE